MPGIVKLRDISEEDLPLFFEMQLEPEANRLAAFTAKDPADREAFMNHWRKILADQEIIKRSILFNDQLCGNIASFIRGSEREVCYWIQEQHWGKGIASNSLQEFLTLVSERPIYARVVKDNQGSLRVLEKCGFVPYGSDRGFSNSRGMDVDEVLLKLV